MSAPGPGGGKAGTLMRGLCKSMDSGPKVLKTSRTKGKQKPTYENTYVQVHVDTTSVHPFPYLFNSPQSVLQACPTHPGPWEHRPSLCWGHSSAQRGSYGDGAEPEQTRRCSPVPEEQPEKSQQRKGSWLRVPQIRGAEFGCKDIAGVGSWGT